MPSFVIDYVEITQIQYIIQTDEIDKRVCKRNDVIVRVNRMEIIENLPITNANILNDLIFCLRIRDNSGVLFLTGLSGKVTIRLKDGRNNRR